MAETSDKALASRLIAGDERAFDEFFDACFAPMYRYALSRLDGDADAAEEVAQNAMMKAVRKLDTYRGEAALLSWLLTFCRHEISAWWERARREPSSPALREDQPIAQAALDALASDAGADPESIAARRETSRLVQVALDRLPRHYGDVLEWKYIEGAAVSEIAARLGTGVKAAESLLTRARAAFRDAFATLADTATEGAIR